MTFLLRMPIAEAIDQSANDFSSPDSFSLLCLFDASLVEIKGALLSKCLQLSGFGSDGGVRNRAHKRVSKLNMKRLLLRKSS